MIDHRYVNEEINPNDEDLRVWSRSLWLHWKVLFWPSLIVCLQVRECDRRRSLLAVGGRAPWWRPKEGAPLPASPGQVDHSLPHPSHPHPSHVDSTPWPVSDRGGGGGGGGQWLPGGEVGVPTSCVSPAGQGSPDAGLWQAAGAHGGSAADPRQWWALNHLHGQSQTSQWVHKCIKCIKKEILKVKKPIKSLIQFTKCLCPQALASGVYLLPVYHNYVALNCI